MVHRVLCELLAGGEEGPKLEDLKEPAFQVNDPAREQTTQCNDKKTKSRKAQEHLDTAVFCVYLRSRREWFYTVGTILAFQPHDSGDTVTIYSAQLGKEKR